MAGPDIEYTAVKANGEYYVMAKELADGVMKTAGIEEYEFVGSFSGSELEYLKVQHPFLPRESLVIVGDHVTLDAGTGCVHTAPAFGVEDFDVCKNYPEIELVVPVDSTGRQTAEAGEFAGQTLEESNKTIFARMKADGTLLAAQKITHSYPHCWRCKEPVMAVCTHGWVVDGEGRAMHKSLGNSISPDEIIKQYGADILRLWVAASDYHAEITMRNSTPFTISALSKCPASISILSRIASTARSGTAFCAVPPRLRCMIS